MARQARKKDAFGRYYIHQYGGNSRCLFQNDDDRQHFADIIKNCQTKYDFILHGYCLSSDNTYELVLDVNGGDISKIMKSINIAYAMYAKCDGQLFKDRYRSELLENDQQLHQIKSQLKSKHCQLDNDIFTVCYYNTDLAKPLITDDFEDCQNCIISLTLAQNKLEDIAQKRGLTVDALLKDKTLRNELIRLFRRHSTLTLKEIGQLFGNLSESTISKLLK